ncbi:MAG: FAD binding domain-containing protein [Fidelibacterota bacterium]
MKNGNYLKPQTVDEALHMARGCEGNYIYLGGGTDIQVHRKQALNSASTVIDLCSIPALHYLKLKQQVLQIGALTTLEELITFPAVKKYWPLISRAAAVVATPVIRKTATVGGNLLVRNRCTFYNQSLEWRRAIGSCLRDTGSKCQITGSTQKCYARNVSDLSPALIALGATVSIQSGEQHQKMALDQVYRPDGLKPLRYLDAGAILTKIEVPVMPGRWWFQKLRLRESLDFTSLTVAGCRDKDNRIRIVVNGVSPAPVLISGAVKTLTLSEIQRQARKGCQTIENDLLPRKYRREMLALYLRQCFDALTQPSG